MIQSPLNYIGGKHRLLTQILPLLPDKIKTFVDLFGGGFNVGSNVQADVVVYNDNNNYVVELLKTIYETDVDEIINYVEETIRENKLSKEDKDSYLKFRVKYNTRQNPLDLYVLICYSFNNQIRFNNSHQFNCPFGKNKSSFNESMKRKLINFSKTIKSKDVRFYDLDFIKFGGLDADSFVYADPPYLITTGSYNDGKRGFQGWTPRHEKMLLELLDAYDRKHISFALSNVFSHKDRANDMLIEWSKKYKVYHLERNYNNCNYHAAKGASDEVLVVNF